MNRIWARTTSLPIWVYTVVIWLSWSWLTLALLASPRDAVKGNTQIVDSWGAIERVALWQNAVTWLIPRFEWSRDAIAWSIRGAFVMLFVMQALAFVAARRCSHGPLWPWLVGPVGAYMIMMFMPPANSDVFYYSMSASLAADNINPYSHTLMQFPDHPLFPFEHWIDIGSVYGPMWTWTGRFILEITGPDPVAAVTGYRIMMSIVSLILIGIAYRMALLLTAKRHHAVAAAVLVAWQPNMVFETVGQVHNDAFVTVLALAGLWLVIAGGYAALRGGIVLVALSTVTKFVTLPILGLLILRRVKRVLDGTTRRRDELVQLLLDGIAIASVYFATFALFWVGPSTIGEMLNEPARLFAHPFWRLVEWAVNETTSSGVAQAVIWIIRILMMVITLGVFAWAALRTMGWYRKPEVAFEIQGISARLPDTAELLFTIMVVQLVLSLVPANAHPWYQVWSVPFVGFWSVYTAHRQPEKWVFRYVAVVGVFTIVYHTRIIG